MGPTGHTGLGLVRVGAKYIQHREVFNTHRIMGQGEGRDFTLAFPHKEWFRGIFWTRPSGTVIFGDHATLSPQTGWSPNYEGRMFVMLREPSSRAARQ